MKVRLVVVGLGRIGMRHATIINEMATTELVATVDIDPTKATDAFDQIPHFGSLEELLDAGITFDVASIATPNGIHCAQAIQCLKAGYDVCIEKPMGINSTDARQVVQVAKELNRSVFVVKQNRFSPPIKWLKEVVDKQILGEVYLVQMNCFWNRDERYYKSKNDWHGTLRLDGGVLYTQFSHFIDIMHWLFGDISNVKTKLRNFNHSSNTEFDDTGITHFEFLSGGVGVMSFTTSVWDQNMESSMTIIGEKGSVKIGGQYMNEIEYCHIKDYLPPQLENTNPPNNYGPYKGSAANHQYVFENIVDVLQHNKSISANGDEGLKVVEIIEKIYRGNS